jgi:hypothetical protein
MTTGLLCSSVGNSLLCNSVIKIKLLAIVKTLKEFKGMLWGQSIKVFTDHKNLMRDALLNLGWSVAMEVTAGRVWAHDCQY